MKPLISVIMPAFNAAHTICDSIDSVYNQSFNEWELIIVDDCSLDHTAELVSRYRDPRIRYFKTHQNSGVAAARNYAISKANGRFIAFLDSDDLWAPNKLERQYGFMTQHDYAFTYTWYWQFRDHIENKIRLIKTKPTVDYYDLLYGNDIGCLTVMIDRDKVNHIFMPSMRHEDYIAWLDILKQGNIAYSLPEALSYYRTSDKSLSGDKRKSIQWTWNVYRCSQHFSILKSFYYLFFYAFKGLKKHYF